ncbi:MAG: 23S rRNA (uracil(1939)-C(5))-methyltransferase RlmD [Oscillospiraceae bacterium]|nr:23S rRNA (uracil(1939)-C(5))-methyltransferase RlmD [Oscillospiraceae bacterium]
MSEKYTAPCPYFRKCGGCQMQTLPYEQQLRRKQRQAEELLGDFGPVSPILGMSQPFHYRNKVHAALGLDGRRQIISGIYQPESHAIVPVESCLIEDETADRIVQDIRAMLKPFKIQVFDERNGTGWLRHILIRRGFSTGQVMVVLVAVNPIFKLQKPFLKALLEQHPEISTVVLNINDRFGPVVLGTREKILFGPGTIEDLLCGCRFRISPRSFYQINPLQTERLYRTAIDFAGLTGKETALDAYCGIGTIGISAATEAKQVIGVEINKDAVKDAIGNARLNERKNCWFTAGDAGEYMEQMARDKMRPDVVFMDPPRAGSDERFLQSLLRCAPSRVVYVSCNPETLARDLLLLTEKNHYRVRKIQPVDMFPFTKHVETVVLLTHS